MVPLSSLYLIYKSSESDFGEQQILIFSCFGSNLKVTRFSKIWPLSTDVICWRCQTRSICLETASGIYNNPTFLTQRIWLCHGSSGWYSGEREEHSARTPFLGIISDVLRWSKIWQISIVFGFRTDNPSFFKTFLYFNIAHGNESKHWLPLESTASKAPMFLTQRTWTLWRVWNRKFSQVFLVWKSLVQTHNTSSQCF